jgi:hypothetical protein
MVLCLVPSDGSLNFLYLIQVFFPISMGKGFLNQVFIDKFLSYLLFLIGFYKKLKLPDDFGLLVGWIGVLHLRSFYSFIKWRWKPWSFKFPGLKFLCFKNVLLFVPSWFQPFSFDVLFNLICLQPPRDWNSFRTLVAACLSIPNFIGEGFMANVAPLCFNVSRFLLSSSFLFLKEFLFDTLCSVCPFIIIIMGEDCYAANTDDFSFVIKRFFCPVVIYFLQVFHLLVPFWLMNLLR